MGTVVAVITADGIVRVVTFPFFIGVRRTQTDIIGADVGIATAIGGSRTGPSTTDVRMGA